MASGGRLQPRGGRQMPVVGEGRQKERGPAGNRPRVCPGSLFAWEIDHTSHSSRVRARGEEERRRRTDLDLRWAATLLVSAGRPPLPRSRSSIIAHRCCGRGERKREGGRRTSTSAGLLLCSSPPADRPCRGAGLHLRLAVRSASSCSALPLPSALLGRPLCHLVLCSAVRSASPLGPGSVNIVYSLL
jgi:hypothetical protein